MGQLGRYDRTQLRIDAARLGLESPLESVPHTNLKVRFQKHHMLTKSERPGMRAALAMCGLAIEGTHHRGIDDARNVARMLPWMVENKLRGKIVREKPLPIMNLAIGALGSPSAAKRWLRTPALVFGWKRPCDVMKSRGGDQQVRDLLERIAHGVYT